jgi:4-nitrophenyl phosphatase
MIGDRLDTDILFGQNGGLSTLLVLTGKNTVPCANHPTYPGAGITKESEVTGPDPSPVVPDYITRSIGDLGVLADA